jgi:hypothetical protein
MQPTYIRGQELEQVQWVQALHAVHKRIPDLLSMGVPIPERIMTTDSKVNSIEAEEAVPGRDLFTGRGKVDHFQLPMELRRHLHPLVPEDEDHDVPAPWAVRSTLARLLPLLDASSSSCVW